MQDTSQAAIHVNHVIDVVTTVAIPFVALFVMTMIEALPESLGWRTRLLKFSWDLTVLSVGIVGGVFALPTLAVLTRPAAVAAGTISVLFSIAAGTAILHLRKDNMRITGLKGFVGLGLGFATLALPVYYILSS